MYVNKIWKDPKYSMLSMLFNVINVRPELRHEIWPIYTTQEK